MRLLLGSQTIAIVDGHSMLRTPVADAILPSTTWARAVALAPSLVSAGVLSGCNVGPIAASELEQASELLSLGGGWVEPIIELDGRPVGDGSPGPVWTALDGVLRDDLRNPDLTEEVPYKD